MRLLLAAAVLLSLLLAGCSSLGYYGQAISGQWQILLQRRPISKLVNDPATPAPLRERLLLVQALRDFAESSLQLPVGRQFSSYVDVQRPFVVWNVFAAPALELQPLRWCYPVAGCVSYRGYFSEAAARTFARQLQAQGHDVYVGGVAAYSTLGWFADPVLNTVIGRESWQLASLLFHELAHQVVYVPGDTAFNESFATTVEQLGLERWLQQQGRAAEAESLLQRSVEDAARREQFVALVQAAVAELRQLYASAQLPEQKLQLKQQRLQQLRQDYQLLRAQWGGHAGYDAWFAQELNNAQLLTVATYNDLVPGFRRLLDACDGELSCFYARVRTLAGQDALTRQQALAAP